MAQGKGSLERSAAQVQITVLGADVLTAVTLILDCERRSDTLVENHNLRDLDLDVSGGHLRVLAFAFDDFSGHLDDIFTAKGSCCLDEACLCVGFDDKLGDSIAVAKVDEGHSSKLP